MPTEEDISMSEQVPLSELARLINVGVEHLQARVKQLEDENAQLRAQLVENMADRCGFIRGAGEASPPAGDLLADAERIVADYAQRNPKWADINGVVQDPWGAHAWLQRYRATSTTGESHG